MRKDVSFPPDWELTPIQCPKCHADCRASFNPHTGACDTLRCTLCPWTLDFVAEARRRNARLHEMRLTNSPSTDHQLRLDRKGTPHHGS